MTEEITEKKSNLEIAPKLSRLWAFLIDSFILFWLRLIILIIIAFIFKPSDRELGVLNWVLAIISFLIYFLGFTIAWGATPGKKILKMRVVNLEGGKAPAGKIILRETLGKWLGIFVLGSIWLFFNEKNREAWDYLAGTIVIRDKE